jgi:exodeoxyribonuclease VII small subunit
VILVRSRPLVNGYFLVGAAGTDVLNLWTQGTDFTRFRRMSKAAKASVAVGAAGAEVSFEEALKQLETVVAAMEAGDLPLETMLDRYEAGTRLAEICQAKLAAAELKIQQLEKRADGSVTLKPVMPDEAEA